MALPSLNAKMTNLGLIQRKSDKEEPVDNATLEYYRNDYFNRAERRMEKMIKYIEANPSKYPLYINPGSTADTDYPVNSNNSVNGIFWTPSYYYNTCSHCGQNPCCC